MKNIRNGLSILAAAALLPGLAACGASRSADAASPAPSAVTSASPTPSLGPAADGTYFLTSMVGENLSRIIVKDQVGTVAQVHCDGHLSDEGPVAKPLHGLPDGAVVAADLSDPFDLPGSGNTFYPAGSSALTATMDQFKTWCGPQWNDPISSQPVTYWLAHSSTEQGPGYPYLSKLVVEGTKVTTSATDCQGGTLPDLSGASATIDYAAHTVTWSSATQYSPGMTPGSDTFRVWNETMIRDGAGEKARFAVMCQQQKTN